MVKNILITGADTGIGRAIAEDLAKKGEKVFANVRKEKDATELAKISNITPLLFDVTKKEEIDTAIQSLQEQISQLDILINNAGIGKGGPLMDMPEEVLRENFEVNVFGLFNVTKACFPLLLKAKGRVINISSVAGLASTAFLGPYCMTKHAVESFSDSLRREILPLDVKVIVIEPGEIITPIWEKTEQEKLSAMEWVGPLFKDRCLKYFNDFIQEAKTTGQPVEVVVKALLKAIYDNNPRALYLVDKHFIKYKFMKFISNERLDKILSL